MAKLIKRNIKTIDLVYPLEDAKSGLETTIKLIMSALTLVSALAWNEAIKGVFDMLKEDPYLKQAGFLTPFLYALLVTLLTVYIINRLEKVQKKINKQKEKAIKLEK